MNTTTLTPQFPHHGDASAAIESLKTRSAAIGMPVACYSNNHFDDRVIPTADDSHPIPRGLFHEENVPTDAIGGIPSFRSVSLADALDLSETDHRMSAEISRRVLAIQKERDPEGYRFAELGGETACHAWFHIKEPSEKAEILGANPARTPEGRKAIRAAFLARHTH